MWLNQGFKSCVWYAVFCFGFSYSVIGQSTVWSENFNNGCASNCLASTYGGWTVLNNSGGISGGAPNDWFVSCAEEGVAPPGCGSTCIGDASLHIGANPGAGGDMGASFNETGASNATFKRATSPTISTVGYSTLTLAFDFIAFGSAACSDDRAQLQLSTDNGATWPAGFQFCLTSVCCGACNGYSQGQWTTYTFALPAAFNNNPNVRVGFHWRNNGNGSGTDPSVAIDDVRITAPVPLSAKVLNLQAKAEGNDTRLSWLVEGGENIAEYVIERSGEPRGFTKVGSVTSSGISNGPYSFRDLRAGSGELYYRLSILDRNGNKNYSNIVRVTRSENEALIVSAFSSNTVENVIGADLWAAENMVVQMDIFDLQGRSLLRLPNYRLQAGQNPVQVDLSEIAAGTYLFSVQTNQVSKEFSPVHISRKFVLTH